MVQLAEICGRAGDEQSLKFYNYYNQLTKPTYNSKKKKSQGRDTATYIYLCIEKNVPVCLCFA